jgi:hypothetical protein
MHPDRPRVRNAARGAAPVGPYASARLGVVVPAQTAGERRSGPSPPPTIAGMQSQGVAGAWVTCCNPVCLQSTPALRLRVQFFVVRLRRKIAAGALLKSCKRVAQR